MALSCIATDDVVQLRGLLESGVVTKGEGRTALHDVAQHGCYECVLELLRSGFDASGRGPRGRTPLHCAAAGGHAACVRLLLTWTGDRIGPQLKDAGGNTPLHLAVEGGHVCTARALLSDWRTNRFVSNHVSSTALHVAARRGHASCVRALLEDLSPPTRRFLVAHRGNEPRPHYRFGHGFTALHCAAWAGHVRCVKLLMSFGADCRARDHRSKRPMHVAAGEGRRECVRALLAGGARASDPDDDLRTALHDAAAGSHEACLELLLRNAEPATIDAQSFSTGATALHYATNGTRCVQCVSHDSPGSGCPRCVRCIGALVNHGASLEARTITGQTPLAAAVSGGRWECASELLALGANPDARDNDQATPLVIAAHTSLKCVRLLLYGGADARAVNMHHRSALRAAVDLARGDDSDTGSVHEGMIVASPSEAYAIAEVLSAHLKAARSVRPPAAVRIEDVPGLVRFLEECCEGSHGPEDLTTALYTLSCRLFAGPPVDAIVVHASGGAWALLKALARMESEHAARDVMTSLRCVCRDSALLSPRDRRDGMHPNDPAVEAAFERVVERALRGDDALVDATLAALGSPHVVVPVVHSSWMAAVERLVHRPRTASSAANVLLRWEERTRSLVRRAFGYAARRGLDHARGDADPLRITGHAFTGIRGPLVAETTHGITMLRSESREIVAYLMPDDDSAGPTGEAWGNDDSAGPTGDAWGNDDFAGPTGDAWGNDDACDDACDDAGPPSECRVCMKPAALVVLYPCGHRAACGACMQQIVRRKSACPVCRADIKHVLRPSFRIFEC